MHHQFRKLLTNAKGVSEHVIAILFDIRGFSSFCQKVESTDVGIFLSKAYLKIIDDYFPFASFYKSTGDGLLLIVSFDEAELRKMINVTVDACLRLLKDFGSLFGDEPMINYETPDKIGIGLARGSACKIFSGDTILDYSGRLLNLASRLMEKARPSGIVFDESFGYELLKESNKELFSTDDIYLRSVAERIPIMIYFTKEYTIISDDDKKPIVDYRWETKELKRPFSFFNSVGGTPIRITLDKEPTKPSSIACEIYIPVVINEQKMNRIFMKDINDPDLSYRKVGRTCSVSVKPSGILSLVEKYKDTFNEETDIGIIFTYPTSQ